VPAEYQEKEKKMERKTIEPIISSAKTSKVTVLKIQGCDTEFIQRIIEILEANFTVLIVGKLKNNDADNGFHCFVTIANGGL